MHASWLLALSLALMGMSCTEGCGSKASRYADTPLPKSVGAAPVRFPLKLSADGRYLVDHEDQPFLIHGEAAWSLFVQLTREQTVKYLEDRRRRGFNLLMVSVIEHHFSDDPPRNRDGEGPFLKAGDFSTPNEAYFRHVDWTLKKAEEYGFAVLLCPAYLGYGGGEEGWYQEEVKNGPDKMRAYGRFLGSRYKDVPNIVWLQGGDFRPPNEHLPLVNAVAEGLREAGATQLQSAHWSPEVSAAEVDVSGWLALNNTYSYEVVYEKCLEDRARGKPFFLIESKYENEREVTAQELRAQAYYALLSGAIGQIFGNAPMWRFDRGWEAALKSPGSVSMTHVRSLFGPRRWMDLVPDVGHRVLVSGLGADGSGARALLAKTEVGDLAIAYLPERREIGIALEQLDPSAKARWYDPTTGHFQDATASEKDGVTTFEPVGRNGVGDGDWVLVFEAPNR